MFLYSFFARSMGWGPSKWLYFVRSPKLLETVLHRVIEVTTWQTVNVVHILTLSMQVKFQNSAVSNVLSFSWWAGAAAQTLHVSYLPFSALNTVCNKLLCFVFGFINSFKGTHRQLLFLAVPVHSGSQQEEMCQPRLGCSSAQELVPKPGCSNTSVLKSSCAQ